MMPYETCVKPFPSYYLGSLNKAQKRTDVSTYAQEYNPSISAVVGSEANKIVHTLARSSQSFIKTDFEQLHYHFMHVAYTL